MNLDTHFLLRLLLGLGVAFVLSLATTPIVKMFAEKVGAMDIPDNKRRVHDHPIPRMGGLAIFLGFILSVVLFAEINTQLQGILLGSVVIVITGVLDDILQLRAWIKFLAQILAAVIAVLHGVVIEILSNPIGTGELFSLNWASIPVTIIWIVAVTNSVNLIDGLDGLAVGVSTISCVTMLVIVLVVGEQNVALVLAALAGACVGFMPFNFNPAKIFMGDTGALFLGYILSTVSIMGMFKVYAVFSFLVPVFALGLPILDTSMAFFRRLAKGQNPMKPDRKHLHHRLLDMGLNQKQVVAILYLISAVLGLVAALLAAEGWVRTVLLCAAVALALLVGTLILRAHKQDVEKKQEASEQGEPNEKD